MAILKIARMGHPVLRRPAAPVEDPTAPEIRNLVADMLETMEDAGGIGLAATQVHVPKRLVLFHVPAEREEDGEATALTVLVNPVLEMLGPEQGLAWEGCLSVPGLRGLVPRFDRIRYTGQGLDGAPIDQVAEGMHARVVQHECDHLDGILYPMRMTDLSQLIFESEWKHLAANAEAGHDLVD
jgi:peptide deformylase